MTYYKPLTPDLRRKIIDGIDSNIDELRTCQNNYLVNIQKPVVHGDWVKDEE